MPREFRNLVMTNIRRIAHPSREAECIVRLLYMQVILVCVAHAAQKTWYAGRSAGGDPDGDVRPAGAMTASPAGISACDEDPAGKVAYRSVHCGNVSPVGQSGTTLSLPVLFSRRIPASAGDPGQGIARPPFREPVRLLNR
jgi:hypothetical protein